MKDLYGVMQLLKQYGIFVYTGDRKSDLLLMESEVKDLFDGGLLMKEDYVTAMLILRKESSRI